MPIEINGKKLYTSKEVGDRFGVSDGMVRYWLREGRIKSTNIGQLVYFTEEQIREADTTPRTRGRRKIKKSKDDDGPAHAGAA